MKYSVCIDAVFNEENFIDSMYKINGIGLNSFEFWSYGDKDIEKILKVKNELNMNVVAFCTKFISLTDETKREEYIKGLKQSIIVAKKLNCNMLITQVGDQLIDLPRHKQHESIVKGLKACIPYLEKENIMLVFEPLNVLVDHKGYYLYDSKEAFEIEKKVNSPFIKVLYDIYHQQITEGNIIKTIEENINAIGHFHGASNPGRQEIDKGEINYSEVIKAIDKLSFKGYIGLEYFPSEEPLKGLKKLVKQD